MNEKLNYKMLKSQFDVMKDRNHAVYALEWALPRINEGTS